MLHAAAAVPARAGAAPRPRRTGTAKRTPPSPQQQSLRAAPSRGGGPRPLPALRALPAGSPLAPFPKRRAEKAEPTATSQSDDDNNDEVSLLREAGFGRADGVVLARGEWAHSRESDGSLTLRGLLSCAAPNSDPPSFPSLSQFFNFCARRIQPHDVSDRCASAPAYTRRFQNVSGWDAIVLDVRATAKALWAGGGGGDAFAVRSVEVRTTTDKLVAGVTERRRGLGPGPLAGSLRWRGNMGFPLCVRRNAALAVQTNNSKGQKHAHRPRPQKTLTHR